MTQPTHIVQVGDIYDFFSFGRFPRSVLSIHPRDEVEDGRFEAAKMWLALQKASPEAECFQLRGNHDSRPLKRILEKAPELQALCNIDQIFQFPNVRTMPSERDELFLNSICFMHGFRSKLGDHARHNQMSTVCGHSHQGGAVFMRHGDRTIWELNCGFIGDPDSEALSYTAQRRISNWTKGVGFIDNGGPRFIPFEN